MNYCKTLCIDMILLNSYVIIYYKMVIVDLKEELDKRIIENRKKKVLKILNGTDKTSKKLPLNKIFYTNKTK